MDVSGQNVSLIFLKLRQATSVVRSDCIPRVLVQHTKDSGTHRLPKILSWNSSELLQDLETPETLLANLGITHRHYQQLFISSARAAENRVM